MDLGKKLSSGPRNAKGDSDRKFFSLRKFIKMVMEGQSIATEMLFAPQGMVVSSSPEWILVRDTLIKYAISQKIAGPFLGFAATQAKKASIKGENLSKLRELIVWSYSLSSLNIPISQLIESISSDKARLGPVEVRLSRAPKQTSRLIEFLSGKWDENASLKLMIQTVRRMEGAYGERSHESALNGIDYKAMSHAFRAAIEAREIAMTGRLTLPLEGDDLDLLKSIKGGKLPYSRDEFLAMLEDRVRLAREALTHSPLREEPDRDKIIEMRIAIMVDFLRRG
jgi:hypothetical protein